MANIFYYFLAFVCVLQTFTNVMVSFKIDSSINLINSEMVSLCVSEKGKLEASQYDDVSYLTLDHNKLMNVVNNSLNSNLTFCDIDTKFYYYDKKTLLNCKIGEYYCNSVQIKINIKYNTKTYERILRYEPVETT